MVQKYNVTVIEEYQRTAVYQVEAEQVEDITPHNVHDGELLWDDIENLQSWEIYDIKRAEDDE